MLPFTISWKDDSKNDLWFFANISYFPACDMFAGYISTADSLSDVKISTPLPFANSSPFFFHVTFGAGEPLKDTCSLILSPAKTDCGYLYLSMYSNFTGSVEKKVPHEN